MYGDRVMEGIEGQVDRALLRALKVKILTENSRRAFKVYQKGERYVFESTWRRRQLRASIPVSAVPSKRALINIRKALYLLLRAGLQGKVIIWTGEKFDEQGVIGTHTFLETYGGERKHIIELRAQKISRAFQLQTLIHELIHGLQVDVLGPDQFDKMYRAYNLGLGYAKNPFEEQATNWSYKITKRILNL